MGGGDYIIRQHRTYLRKSVRNHEREMSEMMPREERLWWRSGMWSKMRSSSTPWSTRAPTTLQHRQQIVILYYVFLKL